MWAEVETLTTPRMSYTTLPTDPALTTFKPQLCHRGEGRVLVSDGLLERKAEIKSHREQNCCHRPCPHRVPTRKLGLISRGFEAVGGRSRAMHMPNMSDTFFKTVTYASMQLQRHHATPNLIRSFECIGVVRPLEGCWRVAEGH